MRSRRNCFLACICFLILSACEVEQTQEINCPPIEGKLFSLMGKEHTSIDFVNRVHYTEQLNTYTYRNFYNGGGVGIGDVNNDGLPDLFFCGNMVSNRLYLNLGDFRFKDVTEEAGLETEGVWTTGVSMADVNGDGWLDIFITKSGMPGDQNRRNELLINAGVKDKNETPHFVNKAEEYGVDDLGFSNHAVFFDYDKDGDLDMYLLNNAIESVDEFDLRKDQRLIRDPKGSNKLYRNDVTNFTDVSEAVGIYSSAICFGLGVSVGDVNKDGWQDLYISNDFFERDYLYLNNQDGTFTESLEQVIGEISLGSMGADMGDINNDGFPEIFVTEMLPYEEGRLKTKAIFESWDRYRTSLDSGYHRQFPRNTLQLNRGNIGKDHSLSMAEISRFAGVHATDWSWGALIADFDNDGLKDLFVANGIYKDLLDLDYLSFFANPSTTQQMFQQRGKFLKELIDKIPSNPLPNFAFRNNGDLTFTNNASAWGLDCGSFSNGSAYGDLDNDGDLDLVVNNVNMAPFIYRNNAEKINPEHHFLTIQLSGEGLNKNALGAQVTVYADDKLFYQELAPMRGFQSTVDNRLHFGLGKADRVDSVRILWPDLFSSTIYDLKADQAKQISYEGSRRTKGVNQQNRVTESPTIFSEVTREFNFDYTYQKSDFNDFSRDPLLIHMVSAEGSIVCVGDVNGDNLQDIYLGGRKGEPAKLYLQKKGGGFYEKPNDSFEADKYSHDSDAVFFDADNDGDLDLYVASGGNEFPSSSSSLSDRLYFNDGAGKFTRSRQVLSTPTFENTSVVKTADYDNDGDMDLFVGVRAIPFQYGLGGNGYILENNGHGVFQNVTGDIAPGLHELGLITSAVWADVNNDKFPDLVIAGEWMPITVFINNKGKFSNKTVEIGLGKSNGFWNCIEEVDIDGDGDLDLVAGNLGLNTSLIASTEKPLKMFAHDFDNNGSFEQIITSNVEGMDIPVFGRNDIVRQIPTLASKYPNFKSFSYQSIFDIFPEEVVAESRQWSVYTTSSSYFINHEGEFLRKELPSDAQLSPIYSIKIGQLNNDDIPDLILGGNFHWAKPQVGIYDASKGTALFGDGKGGFQVIDHETSGFFLDGEIRDMSKIKIAGGNYLLVSKIDGLLIFKIN